VITTMDWTEDHILSAKPISDILAPEKFPFGLFSEPSDQHSVPDGSFLDKVYYTDKGIVFGENSVSMSIDMLIQADLQLALFGLDYLTVGIGEDQYFPFTLRISWSNSDLQLYFEQIKLALRFSNDLVLPLQADSNGLPLRDTNDPKKFVSEPTVNSNPPPRVSIFTTGDIYLDKDFDFDVRGFDSFQLTPCKLASLPIAFAFHDLKLDLSKKTAIPEIIAAGFETDFQGIYIGRLDIMFGEELHFLPDITATNFAIGTGGISGLITASFELNYNGTTFTGDACADLFGIPMGLRKFELNIRANEIIGSEITGQMKLPFFNQPIEIELSIDLKGNYTIGIKGTEGVTLVELTKDDLLSMKVNGFQFSKTDEQVAFALSGSLKPLFGDVKWPEFAVNSLMVIGEKQGNTYGNWDVKLDGGWVQFQEPLSFEIGGFHGSLSKLGFGKMETPDKKSFIGFSGEIGFVSGFALSAKFEDLKLIYPTQPFDFQKIAVELNRARVELVIPNTVQLIGEVSKNLNGFGGMIDITIIPTELRIMGGAEFGHDTTATPFSYMQIMMALELPPPGIQLGALPISIRGFEGKYAMNMTSSMEPGWEWATSSPKGIMPLSKMKPKLNSKLLGAGIKLTSTDGSLLVINALLAILIPGPILIEGRGAILQKDEGSNPSDPPFYALVVIDKDEGFVATNLSYKGNLAKGILELDATMESYFPFQGSGWYIRVGKKSPKSKRIKAVAFKVIEGTSYFKMSKGLSIEAGFYLGFDKKKSFKVGYAKLKGVIQGEADMAWKPSHLEGMLEFDAEITVKACGVGLSIGAGGHVSGKTPYKRELALSADYKFCINLPWPTPDIKKKGKFEKKWEDGSKYECSKFDNLIAEINIDSEMPGIPIVVPTEASSTDLKDVPLVNLDARPTIRFKYPMNDKTSLVLAGNASNGIIVHEIGDDEYEFELLNVTLEKYLISDSDLSKKVNSITTGWDPVTIPYGVWVHDSSMTGKDAASTLRLWAKTPFTHFRQTSYGNKLTTKLKTYQNGFDRTYLHIEHSSDQGLDESNFATYMDGLTMGTAADLSSAVVDEGSYPLGNPTYEWKYLGFEHIPLQYNLRTLELSSVLTIVSTGSDPFDVVELPVIQPHLNDPTIRSIEKRPHGALCKNNLSLRFSIDVQEITLFCIPVNLETSIDDEKLREFKKKFPKNVAIQEFFTRHQNSKDANDSDEKDDGFTYTMGIEPDLYSVRKYPPAIIARHGKKVVSVSQDLQSRETSSGLPADGFSTSTIEGVMIITVKGELPFNSIEFTNTLPASAMFLFAVGYLVASETAAVSAANTINDFVSTVWNPGLSPAVPDEVLSERCLYRLTITTSYNCSNTQTPKKFYFRTEGPPAKYLQSYVSWPLVSDRYPHFRSYKPGIRFKTNYVEQLYKNAILTMRLKSSSGSPPLSGSTDNVLEVAWGFAGTHLLAPEEQAYIDVINATNEAVIDPEGIPPDTQLVFKKSDLLEQDRDYTVELIFKDTTKYQVVLPVVVGLKTGFNQIFAPALTLPGLAAQPSVPVIGVTETLKRTEFSLSEDQTLYSFKFHTSRYVNFVSIFEAYFRSQPRTVEKVVVADLQLLITSLASLYTSYFSSWAPVLASLWLTKVAVMQRTVKEEELIKVQEQLGAANLELDTAFDDAALKFLGVPNRSLQPVPKQVNIIQSAHCIFLEFPEPIESARIQFTYEGVNLTWASDSSERRYLVFSTSAPDLTAEPIPEVFSDGMLNIKFRRNIGDDAVVLQNNIEEEVRIPLNAPLPE
jgi:hypothetical protein